MKKEYYPKFDKYPNLNLSQKDNNSNVNTFYSQTFQVSKDSNQKVSSAYKSLATLNITIKNLKRRNENNKDHTGIKVFEMKVNEMEKIIQKFNMNNKLDEISCKTEEIKNNLKELEDRIFFSNQHFDKNNINQIKNYLEHISLDEYKNLCNELEKIKILKQNLSDVNLNKQESDVIFDINHIEISLDQKQSILKFIKKFRNIFLLKFEYKNISGKNKENLLKYLNQLIAFGNKDTNISPIDFDKLNQESKKFHNHPVEDLNTLKIINELVDNNYNNFSNFNKISNNNTKNIESNDYFQAENNYPNMNKMSNNIYDSFINPALFGNPKNNNNNFDKQIPTNANQNFDFFGNLIENTSHNNNISNFYGSYNKIDNTNYDFNDKVYKQSTINNNIHSIDDFKLLKNSTYNNPNSDYLKYNFNHKNQNTNYDKKLAREMLINEFKEGINRLDLDFESADNFFAGSDDLDFAVLNYYQLKYQEEDLSMTFLFPSGKEFKLVKGFTDNPSSVFEDITNIILTQEKKDVFEFRLLQEGRGLIDIDKNIRYLGGLNIEKNKKIQVKYVID